MSSGIQMARRSTRVRRAPKPPAPAPVPQKKTKKASAKRKLSPKELQLENARNPVLTLPLELISEILSYFPTVPIEGDNDRLTYQVLPEYVLVRTDTLRALSQTCKAWRALFLPMLWETLEVSAVREGDRSFYKTVSSAMVEKGEGIVKNAEIANLVKNMRVVLTRCSVYTALPAFANCLEALPNLKTLSILYAHDQMATVLKDAFKDRVFPQIETVILPTHAHGVLRCCTSAKKVVCNDGDGSQLISAIRDSCPNVEVIEGFYPRPNFVKRIVKAAPNLQEIGFRSTIDKDTMFLLSKFKKLRHIGIVAYSQTEENYADGQMKDIIDIGMDILRRNVKEGKCTLTISSYAYRYRWWQNMNQPAESWKKVIRVS